MPLPGLFPDKIAWNILHQGDGVTLNAKTQSDAPQKGCLARRIVTEDHCLRNRAVIRFQFHAKFPEASNVDQFHSGNDHVPWDPRRG